MYFPKANRDSSASENSQRKARVFPKLEMSQPGDETEREADSMAKSALDAGGNSAASGVGLPESYRQMPNGQFLGSGKRTLQSGKRSFISRKANPVVRGGIEVSGSFAGKLGGGGGSGIPNPVKSKLESGFGADLSGVRLHTDEKAAGLSSEINAKAFTHGQDIYFSKDRFRPNTAEGEELLAHEVAHVVQGGEGIKRKEEDENLPQQVTGFHPPADISKCHLYQRGPYFPTESEDESGDSYPEWDFVPTIDADTGSCLFVSKLIYLRLCGILKTDIALGDMKADMNIQEVENLVETHPGFDENSLSIPAIYDNIELNTPLSGRVNDFWLELHLQDQVPLLRDFILSGLYEKPIIMKWSGTKELVFVYGTLDYNSKNGQVNGLTGYFALDPELTGNTRKLWQLDEISGVPYEISEMKHNPGGTTWTFNPLFKQEVRENGVSGYRSLSKFDSEEVLMKNLGTLRDQNMLNAPATGDVTSLRFSTFSGGWKNLKANRPYIFRFPEHTIAVWITENLGSGNYRLHEFDPLQDKMDAGRTSGDIINIYSYFPGSIHQQTVSSIYEIPGL